MNPKSLLRLIVRPLLGFASCCLRGLGILLLLLAMPASAAITAGTINFGTGHGSFADVSSDYNGLRFTGEWVYYTDSDLTTGFGGVRVPGSTGDTITSTASSGNAIIKSANGTDRFSLTSVKIFAYGVGMTQFTFAGYRNGSPTGSSDTVNVTSATSSFVNFTLSNMTDVDEVRVSNNSPAEAFNFAFDDMAVAPYAASLSLSPTTLSAATVAAAYNQTITASGGTSPYTYAVTAGALPAGMTLSSAGALSGTPTAGGSFNFTITATDSTGGTAVTGSQAYTLTVNAPTLSVSPTSLSDGTLSVAYSQAITASGGTAPYTYAITAGALPTGLSLSSGGSLSGTPGASGTFNFTVTATDSSTGTGPYTGARAYALTILAAPTATTGTASTITATGATLGGTVSSNGASTTVTFEYGLTASYGSSATASQSPLAAGASGSSVSAAITGLSCNTTYHFRVKAVNSVGTTNGSDATFTTSACAPTVTTGSATSITASGATLGGTVSSGGSSTTVTFEYGLTTGYGSSASASQSPLSSGASNSSVSAAISSLSCGTTYHFRVTASNSAGTTNGLDTTFATAACSAPGAPTIGTATAGNAQASVTFTPPASDGGSTITGYTATASPGGATGTCASSPCTVTGLTNGTAYTFTVTATNAVGTGGASAASNSVTPKAPQTITFGNPGAQNFGTTPTLTATATSGLTPTFTSSTTGVCTITSGGALTFVTAGSCTINADQAGDASYLPATQVSQTFTVNAVQPGAPTIGTATAGDTQASVAFTAPTNTGGTAITGYTVTVSPPDVVPVNGASSPIVVTGLTNGQAYTFTVTATNSAGTGPASAASNSITPAAIQTITFANPGAQNFGTSPTLTASSDSGLSVSFTSSTTGVCTITTGGVLTFVTVGSCTINADQAGNASYLPATQVSRTFTVNAVVPGAPTSVSAAAGNTQATVSFTAPASNGGAAITGYTVTSSPGGFTGTGAASLISVTGLTNGVTYTFTVTATNSVGTGSASAASNSVIPKAGQTITFNNPSAQSFGSTPTLTATSDSGLTPTFTSSTTGVCTITTGGALTFVTAGSCIINADQAGNASYLPATQVSRSFTVNPVVPGAPTVVSATAGNAQATVSFTAPASNGGATISGYTVTSSPGGFTGTGAASPIAVTGLTNGVTYTFTVTATNSVGTGTASTASSGVTPTDAPPVASAVSATVAYGSSSNAITLNLTGGAATSVAVAGSPSHGTATASGTSITYTPTAGYSGSDSFTYTATNTGGTSAPATVTITVNPQAPVVGAAAATVAYGSSGNAITLNLTGGAATSVAVAGSPSHGTATASGTSITYTPTAGYSGSDSFTYTATNVSGTSAPATVTITVNPQVPVAGGVSTTVAYGSSSNAITLNLTGGAATSVAVAGSPSHGTATASGMSITYTPTAGYSGSDSFTYTATNAGGTSSAATVTITVNPQMPIAGAVSTTVAYGSSANPITLNLSGGDATSVAVSGAAGHGTATASGTSITYTPTAGYSGSDSFTYTATNAGGTSSAATVTITVNPQMPIAGAAAATVAYGSSGNAITLSLTGGAATSVTIAGSPSHGTATVSGTSISYTPASGYSGSDSFTYTATNAGGTSAPATVTITVNPQAPVAVPAAATVAYGSSGDAITLNLGGGTATSVAVVGAPSHGTAIASGTSISYTPHAAYFGTDSFTYTATNAGGTSAPATVTVTVNPQVPVAGAVSTTVAYGSSGNAITLNLGGGAATSVVVAAAPSHGTATASGTSISYTPNPTYSGTDSFTYTATNAGGTSAAGTVSITVTAQAPVANPVSATVAYGSSDNAISLNVTGGAATSVAVVGAPSHGTATVSGTNISYTPAAGYSGSDSLIYTATNAGGTSAGATISITVAQQLPVAGNVSVSVLADSGSRKVPLNLSGGAVVSVAIASNPSYGTALVQGDSIYYAPATGYVGGDSFTYTASNAGGTSAPGTVTITVEARPDPSKDAEVTGLLSAQANSANRFVQAQIANLHTHLESLHIRSKALLDSGVAKSGLQTKIGAGNRVSKAANASVNSTGTESANRVATCADSALSCAASPSTDPVSVALAPYVLTAAQAAQKGTGWPWRKFNLQGKTGDPDGDGFGLWSAGTITFGEQGSDDYHFVTSGLSIGADKRVSKAWLVGLGLGFGHERQTIGSANTRNTGDSYSFTLYQSFQPVDGVFIDGLLGYGRLDFDARRHITTTDATAYSKRKGSQWYASLSSGYESLQEKTLLAGYGRLDLASTRLKQATETGGDLYNLVYFGQTIQSTRLALGLRGETVWELKRGIAKPGVRLELQHDFRKLGSAAMAYADLYETGVYQVYHYALSDADRNTAVLGLNSNFVFEKNSLWNLGYRFSLGSASSHSHTISGSYKRSF